MKPERWQKVEKLYHAALELEPNERARFLDLACGDDEDLRNEIESLLSFETSAEKFIESPAVEVAANLLAKQHAKQRGSEFGPYRVLSMIGSGGMGEVYLAEDTRLGRKVALKLLPAEFTEDADRARRFEQEARAASLLSHPNILTIFDIGRAEGAHYIATEFIEGETLRQHSTHNDIELGEALDIACQIANALQAAHEAGIVHRDIKPENIMLRPDGIVKVLDFGLAKLTGEGLTPQWHTIGSTTTGMVMGTVRYMSPEQLRAQKVDGRSDLFNLGVVLYEMIAGRPPFAGESSADVIAAIINKEPRPLTEFAPATPEAVERIVTKTLSKDRDHRYQTAKELLHDLKSLKQKLEFEAELRRAMKGSEPPNEPAHAPAIEESAKQTGQQLSHQAIDSIAILPLVNNSDDPNLEYLSDGITESIINTLSQLPKLRVVARSTVFRYKAGLSHEINAQAIGRELKVEAVLTGRVRQIADKLMIATELIAVSDDSQLWGEHYNRNLSDIFDLQDEISREIAEKLRLKLNREEKKRLAKRHTDSVEAYQAYLRGRYFWNKRTIESLNRGVDYFKQAIELDPSYAAAYAGLSDSYTLLVVREALSPEEGFAKAKAAATMALKIDDEFSEAHASLGHAMLHNWEWTDSEIELKRAIELNPAYPSAHHWYSEHLTAMGRCDESIAELKRAAELDPLSLVISADLGRAFYYGRLYDEVMKQEAVTLEMDPNFWLSHINMGRAYAQKGMLAEAIDELQKARELSAGNTEVLSFLSYAYAAAGKKDEAIEILGELENQSIQSHVPPYHIAIVYAGLSEIDQAFYWLERAFEKHAVDLFTLKVEPMFDLLRPDARFDDLLRRLGLAPAKSAAVGAETDADRTINLAPLKTIAVLPFNPISAEGRDHFIELGMADALITTLSNIRQVVVRPTSAVRKYTELETDPVMAGRELKVEAVLEGNIQKLADRIRVTARLVRVEDGAALWAGKFDERFIDIFEVQDSISEKVAHALSLKLSGEEIARITKRYTDNTEAYNLYLRGRYFWNKRSEDALHKSIECFNKAIEIDPGYALAYAGLADAYTFLGDVGITAMSPKEAFSKGKAAAAKALEIDEAMAEAHASMAHLRMHHFEWADAEKEFKLAIELKQSYAVAHQWYSYYLAFNGHIDEALLEIKCAWELDPLSRSVNADLGEILYYARRYDEAITQYKVMFDLDPHYYRGHLYLARAYEQKQMYEKAIAELQTALKLSGHSSAVVASIAHAYALSGERDKAAEWLAKLCELAKQQYVSPYDLALVYAGLGEEDRAFEWLEKAYDERAEWMVYLTIDPRLDHLHSDDRFTSLVRRIGLTL